MMIENENTQLYEGAVKKLIQSSSIASGVS